MAFGQLVMLGVSSRVKRWKAVLLAPMLSDALPISADCIDKNGIATRSTVPVRVLAWLWRHHGLGLGLLWVGMQLALLSKYHGPHYANDSWRYLTYGQRIADSWYFEHGHKLRYLGYPLFVSIWLKLGAGWWGIVLGQLALAGLAIRAFYDAIRRLAGAAAPAALGTAVLILWRDTQQFNVYILTESFFTTFIIFSFWALVRARTPRGWLLAAALMLFVALVRPNGFIVPLAGALAGLVAWRQHNSRRSWRPVIIGLVLSLPLLWFVLNKLLLTFTLIETYQQGVLIYGYYDWILQPDAPLDLPPPLPVMGPVLRLGYFIWHNPVFFGRLSFLKLVLFFSSVKSYYSLLHNVAVVLVIYPCYWLAWRGVRRPDIYQPARVFLTAVVLWQAFVVMMTIEDWDVRFIAVVLPCVFALAALGVQSRWPRLQRLATWPERHRAGKQPGEVMMLVAKCLANK